MGNEQLLWRFNMVDNVFLLIFTIEVALQIIYRGIYSFTDGWITFDFVIILLSWSFSSVQVIRSFRIFRALRLVGRIKSLRELIEVIGDVLPKMLTIFFLLAVIFYIFMVLFT